MNTRLRLLILDKLNRWSSDLYNTQADVKCDVGLDDPSDRFFWWWSSLAIRLVDWVADKLDFDDIAF